MCRNLYCICKGFNWVWVCFIGKMGTPINCQFAFFIYLREYIIEPLTGGCKLYINISLIDWEDEGCGNLGPGWINFSISTYRRKN